MAQEKKTPIELWSDLRDMVAGCERDAQKATRGMKAGGVRLRAEMQTVRDLALDLRKSVLEYRSTVPSNGSSRGELVGANASGPSFLVGFEGEPSQNATPLPASDDDTPDHEAEGATEGKAWSTRLFRWLGN